MNIINHYNNNNNTHVVTQAKVYSVTMSFSKGDQYLCHRQQPHPHHPKGFKYVTLNVFWISLFTTITSKPQFKFYLLQVLSLWFDPLFEHFTVKPSLVESSKAVYGSKHSSLSHCLNSSNWNNYAILRYNSNWVLIKF